MGHRHDVKGTGKGPIPAAEVRAALRRPGRLRDVCDELCIVLERAEDGSGLDVYLASGQQALWGVTRDEVWAWLKDMAGLEKWVRPVTGVRQTRADARRERADRAAANAKPELGLFDRLYLGEPAAPPRRRRPKR